MQTVSRSDEWKQVHKQALLNESFVEVSLDIADPESIADASSQDNGAIYISDSSQLTDGIDNSPAPYCTLEQNLWCLDGKRKAIPHEYYKDECYVGDVLSDDTCIFSEKFPKITIDFKSKVFTKLIPGVTITWSTVYEEFADTFEVIAYNGNTIVASKEVTNNRSVTSIAYVEINNYNRIEIIIKKWCLPNHRARVEEIFVGVRKVYGKADLFDYSHTQSVDPTSLALPKAEVSFSISNVDGEYNPYNTQGISKYLMERQEVKARYGLKMNDGSVEWIKAGTFYLSEWYAKQNSLTADFTGRDIFELLSEIYIDSTELKSRSLFELATEILETAKLPVNSDGSVKWQIDASLKDIYVTVILPKDTRANILQLIANAGMCVLYQDRDGILHIEPLKFDDADYEINSFNSYSRSEITLSKPIQAIRIKAYNYLEDATIEVEHYVSASGEIITIDNPLITYSIDDVYGLHTEHAERVAQWLATHLTHRMTLDSSWRADVRLDALDIITHKNDYSADRVRMTDVTYKFNGAFRATGKGKVI